MSKSNRWNGKDRVSTLVENGYELDSKGRLIHRLVCEQAHGRYPRDWAVTHVDGDRKNNTPQNLIALPKELLFRLQDSMKSESVRYTREQLAAVVRGYVNLHTPSKTKIEINIIVSTDQVVKTEPKVKVVLRDLNKTISSTYR